jgi:penicillin amidase
MRIDVGKWAVLAIAGTVAALIGSVYAGLAASLPRRAGDAAVAGLDAPLDVELDARAIPSIRASSFADALRGQGFLHAQERFFQMDMLRRSAAGEVAELLGERALALDSSRRPFGFRRRARELLGRLPARHLAWLEAYTQGVNAGLADLGARPPEYWLLRAHPAPWRAEDTVLVVFSLYTMLSNNDFYERPQGVMHAVLPPPLYEFLTPSTSRFDRPLQFAAGDPTGGYLPLPVPGPEVIDLSGVSYRPAPGAPPRVDQPLTGPASNQWAVGAARSASDSALLANDPHLGLQLPNVFYRAELHWSERVVRGATIPGLPGVLIGASDALAWGATVSNADQSDWVVVEVDASDPSRYRTAEGTEPFEMRRETIAVAGRSAPEPIEIRSTRWGPIVAQDWLGRPLALHATWLEPGGLSLDLLDLPEARGVAEGLDVLTRWAGPSLNWMLTDAEDVGWVMNGPLPRRVGFEGERPESWRDGSRYWQHSIQPPALHEWRDAALYTANNRTLPRESADALSRTWMRPLRAQRIEELLADRSELTERDFLAMQLDTRAAGYDALRDLVLEVVPGDEPDPLLRRAREHVRAWNGRADAEQVGFRLLHVYYRALLERVLAPLLAAAADADPRFVYRWPLADETLRRVLDERPPHLLTADFADWPAFFRDVLLESLRAIERDGSRPGIDASWGEVNTLDVGHPFAALPTLAPLRRWLALPAVPSPGSFASLRVAAPSYGAVLRMAVSPARPSDGILQMSGGQSGHFLSPNFADLQADWIDGTPTPFLAGPTVARFLLEPAPGSR